MQDPRKPDMSGIESIEADTRYGIAAKLSSRCYPDGAKAVILASGEHEMVPLIANGLAGALDAPILLTQNESVPDITVQELTRLNPQTVYVLNGGTVDMDAVRKEVKAALPLAAIAAIEGKDARELSWAIYEYGDANALWDASIALTYDGCLGDLASLSPYLYSKKCPVLVKLGEEAVSPKMCEMASQKEETLIIGGFKSFPDEGIASIAASFAEIHRFVGDGPYDANEKINMWIGLRSKSDSFLVVSIWHPEDALTVGPFAAKSGSLILLEDPQNLDSVAHAIAYIGKNKKHLRFVGDRTRINDLDKELLVKASS